MKLLRSLLFVPGDAENRFEKAFASGADAVIQDLEDAVPPAKKQGARQSTSASLARSTSVTRLVRVNARDTPFCWEDLQAVVVPGLDGIVLPKAADPGSLAAVAWVVSELERARGMKPDSVELIPLIESATGVAELPAIVRACSRIRRVTFGAVDLSAELGLELDGGESQLAVLRWQLVIASRSAGLEPPIDTVFVNISDTQALGCSVRRARMLGFQGKLCIHPSQVEPVNQGFLPDQTEVMRARRIVESLGTSLDEAGAASVDGMMVDRPVLERAMRVLALAQASKPTQGQLD